MDLFTTSATLAPIPVRDGALSFMTQLPLPWSNDEVLARLIDETDWRSDSITLWGKQFLQPRLSAWYGEAAYRYSGLRLTPQPFTTLQTGNPRRRRGGDGLHLQQRPAQLLS